MSLSFDRETYEVQRKELDERLLKAEHELYIARIPAVICYEGWDAGGKGGNIKRLTQGLDPRGYEVVPIAAPTKEEKAHHYLWRFWQRIPKAGHITIFDRTWYGRVLVERVEGFCSESRMEAGLRRDQPVRAAARRFRRGAGEVLVADRRRGAAPPFPGAAEHALQAVEDHRRRLAQPREAARSTSRPSTRCSAAPARRTRPGRSWRPTASIYARIKALRTVAEALEKAVGRL